MQWWRQQDSSEAYWLLAFSLLLVLAALAAHRWRARRVEKGALPRRSFDAAAVAAELARHNPTEGELVAFRDGDGEEFSVDEEPVRFLHRDGELLCKGKAFYLAAGAGEALLKSLRRGRIARVQFGPRAAQRSVEVRAVGRKRLPKRVRHLVDEDVNTCWQVVAVGLLQDEQDRELVRYYLQKIGGESAQICPYVDFRLFVYVVEAVLEGQMEIGSIVQRAPNADSAALEWQRPTDAVAAVAQVLDDLRREEVETVWLAKFSAAGERRPLGFFRVLGVRQPENAGRLKLRCPWRVGDDEDAIGQGDDLALGYASGDEQRELLARVVRRRGRSCDLELRTLPRADAGLSAEVVDFSASGMRLALSAEGLDRLGGLRAEDRIVAISAYPHYAFPDKAQEYAPMRRAKIELLARVERVEGEGASRQMGVRFVYEPLRYDTQTGQVLRWRSLRDWEAKPLLDIHRALGRLYGYLNSEMPAQDV